jgi:hypothetical protein
MVSVEMKPLMYCYDDHLVPRKANYCCAVVTALCSPGRIRARGAHYSHVFGTTASLSENFLRRRRISGPCWVRVCDAEKHQKLATVPMFSVPTIDSVTPLPYLHPAPMNLCTMAIRSVIRSHEIFMISLRIFRDWDIENFSGSGLKHVTFVCPSGLAEVAPDATSNATLKVLATEHDLLKAFAKALDDYDVDIIASYGLTTFDIPLLFDRMRAKSVDDWWRIGRLKRTTAPKQGRLNIQLSLSGRVPCDGQTNCIEQMRAKSNDLSAAVQWQFGHSRQMIDHVEVARLVSMLPELTNLVNYNIRHTSYVAQLLNALQVLPDRAAHGMPVRASSLVRLLRGANGFFWGTSLSEASSCPIGRSRPGSGRRPATRARWYFSPNAASTRRA